MSHNMRNWTYDKLNFWQIEVQEITPYENLFIRMPIISMYRVENSVYPDQLDMDLHGFQIRIPGSIW